MESRNRTRKSSVDRFGMNDKAATHIAGDFSSFDSLLDNWVVFAVHCLETAIVVDGFLSLLLIFDLQQQRMLLIWKYKRACNGMLNCFQIYKKQIKAIKSGLHRWYFWLLLWRQQIAEHQPEGYSHVSVSRHLLCIQSKGKNRK